MHNLVGCNCETRGTVRNKDTCDLNGVCTCQDNFEGEKCDKCSPGHSNFPSCTGMLQNSIAQHTTHNIFYFVACDCDRRGTKGNADICDDNGQCKCQKNVEGEKCTTCLAGRYNFPTCTGN